MEDLYTPEAQARRDKFNNIIDKIDMVLMNNIPEVDDSIWDNWESNTPGQDCDIVPAEDAIDVELDGKDYYCTLHQVATDDEFECDESEGGTEVYQWFAVNESDAKWLVSRNQYITYSDMLDTYFLAITHFGTSWDYVDSMVSDILQENE